jgi:uncharacterized membrane protein YkoI
MRRTISVILSICFVLGLSAWGAQGQSSEAQLMKEATITKAQAEKTALARVPQGGIKSAELEKEHGKLVWSFDIARPGTKDITEIQVDAKSGKIVAVGNENPRQQAAEASAEKTKR